MTIEKEEYNKYQKSLVSVLAVQTATHKQEKMIEYIENTLNSLDISYIIDKSDNIIVKQTNDPAPFVVAHMDTVHQLCDSASIFCTKNGDLFMMNTKTVSQIGIGGDKLIVSLHSNM